MVIDSKTKLPLHELSETGKDEMFRQELADMEYAGEHPILYFMQELIELLK